MRIEDYALVGDLYDVHHRRQVGNFPQVFSHLALIEAARTITTAARGDGSACDAPLATGAAAGG